MTKCNTTNTFYVCATYIFNEHYKTYTQTSPFHSSFHLDLCCWQAVACLQHQLTWPQCTRDIKLIGHDMQSWQINNDETQRRIKRLKEKKMKINMKTPERGQAGKLQLPRVNERKGTRHTGWAQGIWKVLEAPFWNGAPIIKLRVIGLAANPGSENGIANGFTLWAAKLYSQACPTERLR